jgi:hypothetical protein
MELTKRDRWEIWMQDLDEKLDYHLYQLKEQKKPNDQPIVVVEVRESDKDKGWWEVWHAGTKRFIYDGPLAHYRATKKAAEILNEIQSAKSNPIQ